MSKTATGARRLSALLALALVSLVPATSSAFIPRQPLLTAADAEVAEDCTRVEEPASLELHCEICLGQPGIASGFSVCVLDNAGHTTSRTVGTASIANGWNADDGLQWSKDPGGKQLGGCQYDAGSLRRRKASSQSAEGDRIYVYDATSFVAELDAATGSPKLEYIYGTELWGVIDYSQSQSNPTVQWMHRDGMRSVVERTADLGSGPTRVAGPFRYDAFGGYRNTPEATQPGADGQTKIGYTGHVFDVETGLVYAKARYYQPELGRWLSQDALEGQMDRAPSLNRYSYAGQNPYRYYDPSGYQWQLLAIPLIGMLWIENDQKANIGPALAGAGLGPSAAVAISQEVKGTAELIQGKPKEAEQSFATASNDGWIPPSARNREGNAPAAVLIAPARG